MADPDGGSQNGHLVRKEQASDAADRRRAEVGGGAEGGAGRGSSATIADNAPPANAPTDGARDDNAGLSLIPSKGASDACAHELGTLDQGGLGALVEKLAPLLGITGPEPELVLEPFLCYLAENRHCLKTSDLVPLYLQFRATTADVGCILDPQNKERLAAAIKKVWDVDALQDKVDRHGEDITVLKADRDRHGEDGDSAICLSGNVALAEGIKALQSETGRHPSDNDFGTREWKMVLERGGPELKKFTVQQIQDHHSVSQHFRPDDVKPSAFTQTQRDWAVSTYIDMKRSGERHVFAKLRDSLQERFVMKTDRNDLHSFFRSLNTAIKSEGVLDDAAIVRLTSKHNLGATLIIGLKKLADRKGGGDILVDPSNDGAVSPMSSVSGSRCSAVRHSKDLASQATNSTASLTATSQTATPRVPLVRQLTQIPSRKNSQRPAGKSLRSIATADDDDDELLLTEDTGPALKPVEGDSKVPEGRAIACESSRLPARKRAENRQPLSDLSIVQNQQQPKRAGLATKSVDIAKQIVKVQTVLNDPEAGWKTVAAAINTLLDFAATFPGLSEEDQATLARGFRKLVLETSFARGETQLQEDLCGLLAALAEADKSLRQLLARSGFFEKHFPEILGVCRKTDRKCLVEAALGCGMRLAAALGKTTIANLALKCCEELLTGHIQHKVGSLKFLAAVFRLEKYSRFTTQRCSSVRNVVHKLRSRGCKLEMTSSGSLADLVVEGVSASLGNGEGLVRAEARKLYRAMETCTSFERFTKSVKLGRPQEKELKRERKSIDLEWKQISKDLGIAS